MTREIIEAVRTIEREKGIDGDTLITALEDAEPDVQWNAAIALARHGRHEGVPVLRRMLDRAYEPNFFVPLMAKDLAYARQAFGRAGIELKSADVAREAFLAAERAGFGEKDIASIVELLRR